MHLDDRPVALDLLLPNPRRWPPLPNRVLPDRTIVAVAEPLSDEELDDDS